MIVYPFIREPFLSPCQQRCVLIISPKSQSLSFQKEGPGRLMSWPSQGEPSKLTPTQTSKQQTSPPKKPCQPPVPANQQLNIKSRPKLATTPPPNTQKDTKTLKKLKHSRPQTPKSPNANQIPRTIKKPKHPKRPKHPKHPKSPNEKTKTPPTPTIPNIPNLPNPPPIKAPKMPLTF